MAVVIFIIGLIFGSFGSVLLTRLSSNKFDKKQLNSVFFGWSYCPKCKKRLKAQNLIPLFSYINQKGKCANCSKKISFFYPSIEIISGLLFLFTYIFFPYSDYFSLFFWLLINRTFLLIIIYDFIKYELHIPVLTLGVIISLLPQFININGDYKIAFWSSIFLLIIYLFIYRLSKIYVKYRYKKNFEGIGLGDVILSFYIGTLFPFIFIYNNIIFDITNTIQIILSFILISGILGIIIRLSKYFFDYKSQGVDGIKNKLKISSQNIIPFLPAMIVAYRILLFYGKFILDMFFR